MVHTCSLLMLVPLIHGRDQKGYCWTSLLSTIVAERVHVLRTIVVHVLRMCLNQQGSPLLLI